MTRPTPTHAAKPMCTRFLSFSDGSTSSFGVAAGGAARRGSITLGVMDIWRLQYYFAQSCYRRFSGKLKGCLTVLGIEKNPPLLGQLGKLCCESTAAAGRFTIGRRFREWATLTRLIR